MMKERKEGKKEGRNKERKEGRKEQKVRKKGREGIRKNGGKRKTRNQGCQNQVISRPERKAKKEIERKKFSTKTIIMIFIPLMIIHVLYMFYVLNVI